MIMNQTESFNCIVCADEFNPNELTSIVLSKINSTKFKICDRCLSLSDPSEDYKQARDIINSYACAKTPRQLFSEAKDIIVNIKTKSTIE